MKIWIFNQHNMPPDYGHLARHYYFAEQLKKRGHEPVVFVGSSLHNTDIQVIKDDSKYALYENSDFPYVFVKTCHYRESKRKRLLSMWQFYRGLFRIAKDFEAPDVIIGSSPHPLACVAAIRLSKRYKCKNIVEIRDLWPETFVAYGLTKKNSIFTRMLYRGERWIYKKADALIFTAEGGKDYIIEKGWDKEHGGPIDLAKVHYINNGVDLEQFDNNAKQYIIDDEDLNDPNIFKVVYAGSIRLVNKVGELVEAAKILRDKGNERIKLLLWGDGDELEELKARVEAEQLGNICFKGRVGKQYIPHILSKSDLNIYILPEIPLYRFGLSLNKSFEYFASGKPVLASANSGYSIIDKFQCGHALDKYNRNAFVNEIIAFSEMPAEEYQKYCRNARTAAAQFDFQKLTDDLIKVIEKVCIK